MSINLNKSDKSTAAVLSNIRATIKGDKVWAAFVAESGVTVDTITEYAEALAGLLYVAGPVTVVNPTTGKRDRTPYGNALNAAKTGLKRALVEPSEDDSDTVTNLLTRAGVNADLDTVVAAWHAAQK